MTRFPPAVMPATFCEVTYDSDWFEPDDRHLTPYRYSLMRNDETNSDTVSLTLPSYSYYEYLRSLYDCRTTPSRIPTGYQCPPGSHLSEQGRATTWHAFNKDTGSELSRQAARSEPVRIRPTYPFPSLHLIQQGGDSGDELEEEFAYADRTKEKLVWVDALNKWVPQKQLHPRPYMSFVGNPPVIEKVEKIGRVQKEVRPSTTPGWVDAGMKAYMSVVLHKDFSQHVGPSGAGEGSTSQSPACRRFEGHMAGARRSVTPPTDTTAANRASNNEKREAIRRRAQELAEQRKQRKAYSTPPYTSHTDRKHKPRVQSSRGPQSMPVSPTPQKPKDRIPPPKHVWHAEEGSSRPGYKSRNTPSPRPNTPVKKEISITLVSSRSDEGDGHEEAKDRGLEKKVTFTDKTLGDKKRKVEDLNNNSADAEARLAEQRLIESLERQRQLEQEQQRHLLSEQAKEEQRRAEEERLRRLRDSNNLHKQPLSQKAQNHENYYENTMNAAAKQRRKGKGNPSKSQTIKVAKPEKGKKGRRSDEDKPVKSASDGSVGHGERAKPQTPPEKENKPRETHSKKVKEKKASRPILAGMGSGTKPTPALSSKPKVKKGSEVKLPVTTPTEIVIEEASDRSSPKSLSPDDSRRRSQEPRETVKKERRDGVRRCSKKPDEDKEDGLRPEPDLQNKPVDDWIYGDEDTEQQQQQEKGESSIDSPALPSLAADLSPEFIAKEKREKKEKQRKAVLANLIHTDHAVKKWRKPGPRDSSYADDLRRQELAEERRRKQSEMYDRLRNRKLNMSGDMNDDGSPHFEDYGFLSKYCIFTRGNIDMYRHAFEAVDIENIGWLEGEDVMIALRGVNNRLTEAEEEYLYRVLELTGYKLTHGADFKMFSVLAALSQRIVALDKWMKNLIGSMDFKSLEMKMFKCKALWECNVDRETNSISIDQLCVDLRAGGVSFEHEMEVREKLAHHQELDLLDFLTYIPLFIMIHEAVVKNPLDDTRDK